jgi:hypothetical protein
MVWYNDWEGPINKKKIAWIWTERKMGTIITMWWGLSLWHYDNRYVNSFS